MPSSKKKHTVYRWTSENDDEWNKEVFVKQNGEYVGVGRSYDYRYLPYGNFYVENCRNKGWRRVDAMPQHLELESAIDDCRDQLVKHLQEYHKKLYETNAPYSYHDLADVITDAVKATIHDRKMEMIHRLKQ